MDRGLPSVRLAPDADGAAHRPYLAGRTAQRGLEHLRGCVGHHDIGVSGERSMKPLANQGRRWHVTVPNRGFGTAYERHRVD